MATHVIELIAANWAFSVGRMNTVRKGFKWSDRVDPGHTLAFRCPDDGRELTVVATSIKKTLFCQLSDREVGENHAFAGRTELKEALVRAYGEFGDHEPITIIEFLVKE